MTMPDADLKILIVDQSELRASICINLENPNRDILEQIFQVSRLVNRPVAMFVNQSNAQSIAYAACAR